MTEGYAPIIRDALWDPSPRESASRVKTAVANGLSSLDPTAQIRTTDYFNHSFAPDIILLWSDSPPRGVFLRLDADIQGLAEGARLVDDRQPLLIGLDAEGLTGEEGELPEESDALLSTPRALDSVITSRRNQATGPMLGNALAQGGRGVVFESQASELSETLASGFAGASAVQVEPTSDAVKSIQRYFAPAQASRMTRVLQAVWEGNLGRPDEFPGPRDLSGRLGSEATQYLLDIIETEDLAFWRQVGRRLTISDLAALDLTRGARNFDLLVAANLDVLEARACALIDDPQREFDADLDNRYRWTKRRGRVALDCPGFYVLVGQNKPDIENHLDGPRKGLGVSDFVARAGRHPLHEVSIQGIGDGLTYTSEEGSLDQDRLKAISAQLGPAVEVRRAVAQTPSGRVTIDFPSASGTGQTRSRVLAADLLAATVPLVRLLDHAALGELEALLEYESKGAGIEELPLGGLDEGAAS